MRTILCALIVLLAAGSAWAQLDDSDADDSPDATLGQDRPQPPPPRRSSGVGAQKIYKFVLPDGRITYSDKPPEEDPEAREVTLSPLQTYSPPPTPPLQRSAKPEKKGHEYQSLEVTSPSNDATLRDNGGNVQISIALSPGLQPGHSIDISMDGKSIGSGNSTSVTLTNVDRGSHTVQAKVLDEDGKAVLSSNSVTFHLLRTAVRPSVSPRAGP